MEFQYQLGAETKTVTIERDGAHFRVRVGDKIYHVIAKQSEAGQLNLEVDQQRLQVYVARAGAQRYVTLAGQTWILERLSSAQARRSDPRAGAGSGLGGLEATMPGLVLEVLVAEGEAVERGQTLVLLEAMKMELRIAAPYAGRVRQVHCAAGQVVERSQVLVELEAGEA